MQRTYEYDDDYRPHDGYPTAPPAAFSPYHSAAMRQDLYSTDQARLLMRLWQAMEGCIRKCMLNIDGNYTEMVGHFCVLKDHCSNIIMKNMRDAQFRGVPPCMYSAAVHSHIMQQNLYCNPKWRLICAVFEFTSMEIAAEIMQKHLTDQRALMYGDHMKTMHSAKVAYDWVYNGQNPHALIKETHTKVHETGEDVQDLREQLEDLVRQLKDKR